ncbi:hypothetical protein L1987_01397 [Smallanthus sonchifolius]|uniref:Uncharacterized protein n=1 Tax=Smallanthus sonchifolius TaxID=185202 RepID=A0ACB9K4X4_9ASTR|nr:hypothetical protein L1987_01397 [Smallanthus sonchifolius]
MPMAAAPHGGSAPDLLSLLCRKRPLDNSFELGMATWAQDSIKAHRLMDMVDSDIRSEISRKCLKKFVKIIDRCLDYNPKNRPTMDVVVRRLKKVLTLEETTDNLLQSAGKTMFDKLPFTRNGENAGMDFRSLVPKMPHIDMDFRSFMPKMPHIDMDFRSLMPKMPHIDMDFRSLMHKMPHVRMEFGSLMHKKKKLLMLRESYFQEYGSSMLFEDELKNSVGSIKIFQAKELEKATMDFAEYMIIGKGENRPSMKEVTMELERIRKLSMHSWGSLYNDDEMSSFMTESEQDGLYDNLNAYNDTFSM